MVRTIGIWVSGLFGFGLAGIILGSMLDKPYDSGHGVLGFFAGLALFATLRLWLAPRAKSSN